MSRRYLCEQCGEEYGPDLMGCQSCILCGGDITESDEEPNCQVHRDQQFYPLENLFDNDFIMAFGAISNKVHKIAVDHGWWDSERTVGETIAICHSELSEALEAARNGYPVDDKLPEHGNYEVEMADTIIRIMDDAGRRGINLGQVIIDKIKYNRTRTFKHGGKRF